ncbi:MAG: phosphatase PAP2 family protein [Bacilli bacterium]|nr:phosphatase PAP2 family protein [Bacilli bacterium]
MKKRVIISLLCLIGFLLVTVLVVTNNTSLFDEKIYQAIYGHHNQYLDFFFTTITHIGDTVPVMIIAMILLIVFKDWNDKIHISFSLFLTVAFNQILKYVIARPRPPLERRLVTQGGYSYPSGHSMVSLCLYGILIYFAMTKIKNKSLKIICVSLLTVLILIIGISRIYVGVHYPSDVLGGYLLAAPLLITSVTLLNRHFKGERK